MNKAEMSSTSSSSQKKIEEPEKSQLSEVFAKLQVDQPEEPINAVFDIIIPPSLADYHCHFNWVYKFKDRPFTQQEAETIQRTLTDKFDAREEEDTYLKYNGIKIIAEKAIQAFCNIALNREAEGEVQIAEASEIISKCSAGNFFPEEYTEGLEYVVRGLHMFYLCHRIERYGDEDAKEKLEMMIPSSVPFESLGVKGQVAVRIMEHHFGGSRRSKNEERVHSLEDIIKQDGNYFLWHYELYSLLLVRRRLIHHQPGKYVGPDVQEKALILKAVELAPDNPFVIACLCRCLAEIFRTTHKSRNERLETPIEMGDFGTFKTVKQVLDCAQKLSKQALELYEGSARINIRLAEIFSVVLPFHFRDYHFAKVCIQRALNDNPNSSKVNHRMAVILLANENNPSEALKYLKHAVASDPRNYPALSEMIKTMMGDIQKNEKDLEKLFQKYSENPWCEEDKQGDSLFLYGMFLFIKKDTISAVDNWIKAHSKNPESVQQLKYLGYNYKRYGWKHRDISIQDIQSLLKKSSTDVAILRSQEEKKILQEILEIVDGIILEERKKQNGADFESFESRRSYRGSLGSYRADRNFGSNSDNWRKDDNNGLNWPSGRGGNSDSVWGRGNNDNRRGRDRGGNGMEWRRQQ